MWERIGSWLDQLPVSALAIVASLVALLCLVLGSAAWAGERATVMLDKNNAERALPLLQSARWLDPLNSEIAHQLAQTYQAVGNSGKAIMMARSAVRLDRDYPLYWSDLARVLNAAGQAEPAIAAAEKALALQPMLDTHYWLLGQMLGDRMVSRLLENEPGDVRSMAIRLVDLGNRLSESREASLHHRSLWPSPEWSPSLQLVYGQGLYLMGSPDLARTALEKASNDPATAPMADVWLLRLYQQSGDVKRVNEISNRPWVQFAPMNPVFRQLLDWRWEAERQ
jgi:tetratricopeptide (TPR) repeat protein